MDGNPVKSRDVSNDASSRSDVRQLVGGVADDAVPLSRRHRRVDHTGEVAVLQLLGERLGDYRQQVAVELVEEVSGEEEDEGVEVAALSTPQQTRHHR